VASVGIKGVLKHLSLKYSKSKKKVKRVWKTHGGIDGKEVKNLA